MMGVFEDRVVQYANVENGTLMGRTMIKHRILRWEAWLGGVISGNMFTGNPACKLVRWKNAGFL